MSLTGSRCTLSSRCLMRNMSGVTKVDFLLVVCVCIAVALAIYYRVQTGNEMIGL